MKYNAQPQCADVSAVDRFVAEVVGDVKAGRLKLPMLPKVAFKVRQKLSDDKSSSEDVARIIATDPALSARLLQVVNCPLYNNPAKCRIAGDLSDACIAAGVRCTSDDTDTAFKLFIGDQFVRYIALEGGYVNLGELEAGVSSPVLAEALFDVHGGFVSLLPQFPIGDPGAVYGRLGLMVGDGEIAARVPSIAFDDSDSGSVAGVSFVR